MRHVHRYERNNQTHPGPFRSYEGLYRRVAVAPRSSSAAGPGAGKQVVVVEMEVSDNGHCAGGGAILSKWSLQATGVGRPHQGRHDD